jgi:hypothetical protein
VTSRVGVGVGVRDGKTKHRLIAWARGQTAKDERSVTQRGMTRWSDTLPLARAPGGGEARSLRYATIPPLKADRGGWILSSRERGGWRKEDKDFGRMGDMDPRVDENKGA